MYYDTASQCISCLLLTDLAGFDVPDCRMLQSCLMISESPMKSASCPRTERLSTCYFPDLTESKFSCTQFLAV